MKIFIGAVFAVEEKREKEEERGREDEGKRT